ncbi:hypothetical protein CPC08DRAFT_770565 [Agrocybe pediades]|nr:hypothetical protein CPC08DRAFT_770565 [Agrocybe pediades]
MVSSFLISGNLNTSLKSIVLATYWKSVYTVMAGLAPTLMVARLAAASGKSQNKTTTIDSSDQYEGSAGVTAYDSPHTDNLLVNAEASARQQHASRERYPPALP